VWVAVGTAVIQTSTDGTTWTSRTVASSYSGNFLGVASSGTVVVAVGSSGGIQSSPDGTTWTARTPASSYSGPFWAVTWSSTLSLFVAVGNGGVVQTSPNGTTWTARTAGSNDLKDVVWASEIGTLVAVGNSGSIYTSTDSITWTARTPGSSLSGQTINCATWTGAVFVAGMTGQALETSIDGITWSPLTREPTLLATNGSSAMCVGLGMLLIVGGNGGIRQSLVLS
jgi:hypothetical protein